MKNNVKSMILAAVAASCAAAALTGCGQARSTADTTKTTEAPVIKVTEKVTEAPQTETQAPQTETAAPQTETAAPQTETQAPQTETQPQTAAVPLSKEEEIAQETDYDEPKTMWAIDVVNIRDLPTTDEDNVLWATNKGDPYQIVGETPNWYEIQVDDTDEEGNSINFVGFIAKQFMSSTEDLQTPGVPASGSATPAVTAPAEATPAETTAPETTASTDAPAAQATAPASGGTTVTMAADANIRADASQVSDVLGTVAKGEQVTVIGDADGWYQVNYNGVQGYVNKNLVG